MASSISSPRDGAIRPYSVCNRGPISDGRRRRQAVPLLATAAVMVMSAWIAVDRAAADPIPSTSDLPTTTTQNQSKYPEINEAMEKFKTRDFDGALETLKTASQKYAELPPGEVLMSQMMIAAARSVPARNQGSYVQSARSYLERAVVASPDDPEAYLIFGNMALSERQYTDASLLLDKAMGLTQAMNDANERKNAIIQKCHAGLAAVAESRKNWEEAKAHLNAWLATDAENASARYRLGRALFKSDKRKEAYEEFKAASALNEKLTPPEVTLAQLFEQDGNETRTADWMAHAIKVAESKPAAYQYATRLGVSNWHWRRDEVDKAKEHATAAANADPASVDAKLTLGLIARYEKDMATAERIFSEVHRDQPDNFVASNQLAVCLADQGVEAKLQRALGLADSNARAQRANPSAAATLGWVYYRLGRVEEAERAFQAVATTRRLTPDVVYYLATVLAERDRADNAITLLRGILDNPGPQIYRAESQKLYDSLQAASNSSSQ